MNTRKQFLTVAMAGMLGSSTLMFGTNSFATDAANAATDASASEAVAAAGTETTAPQFIKTADEALNALQQIRAARVAIFNGDPENAAQLSDVAQKDLTTAQGSMNELALKTEKSAAEGDVYIPFDASMSLVEGFVPDEASTAVLTKANEHLAKGENDDAVKALKLGNIDVSVSAALIPAASSLKHVDEAIKLLEQKKYYEANLALKAVEDSVLIEQYDLQAIPAQGS